MPTGDGEPATATRHFDVRFVAVAPAGAVEQISDESSALGWFDPEALPDPLADGVIGQLAAALAASARRAMNAMNRAARLRDAMTGRPALRRSPARRAP